MFWMEQWYKTHFIILWFHIFYRRMKENEMIDLLHNTQYDYLQARRQILDQNRYYDHHTNRVYMKEVLTKHPVVH